MGDMAGLVVRSMVLSVIMGMSCQAFFETIVPRKKFRFEWMEHTAILAFAAGFMVIAVTRIPPFALQPVRVIVVSVVVAGIYFQMGIVKNLILSVVFCGIYWIVSILFVSVMGVMPLADYREVSELTEPILDIGYLCLMLMFRDRYQSKVRGLTDIKWGRFGLLALIGIAVSTAIAMMSPQGSAGDGYARLFIAAGFAVVYVFSFYYMVNMLEKESQMQKLRLLHERTQNQMNLYRGMKKQYEQQRRYQHDYKNQLSCIQGLIGDGQTKEALEYISRLTGSLWQNKMCVNTNHGVVNVVLNQKYQEACDKGILMTMTANDLSGLTLGEEDLVTLLGNLFDNAIEACEKLEQERVIQFKMVLEEDQLILSIRNPVSGPVKVKDNRIVTSKRDKSRHGIGLLNVETVIKKKEGTSVLKCEGGWFSFAAMIPNETVGKNYTKEGA